MEKSIKVNAPKGFIVDQDKSTFEEIFFKEVEVEKYPMKWEELCEIKGYYVHSQCNIYKTCDEVITNGENKNVFPEKSQAEAVLALSQLLQLRNRWVELYMLESHVVGVSTPTCILVRYNDLQLKREYDYPTLLDFPSFKLAEKFRDTFEDLLHQAKILL